MYLELIVFESDNCHAEYFFKSPYILELHTEAFTDEIV